MVQVPQTPAQYVEQPEYYEDANTVSMQPVQYVEQPVQYVEQPIGVQYVEAVPQQYVEQPEEYYEDFGEPTETDIGDGADLDEGTVTAKQYQREPAPVIF